MKTITEMRAAKKALIDKIQALRDQVANENRDLVDEERDGLKGWLAEIDQLDGDIKLEEKTQATIERSKKPEKEPVKPDPEERSGVELNTVEQEKRDRFKTFGDQLRAVAIAGTNNTVDQRLINQRAATGLSEGVASDGGFLVQSDFSTKLIENVWAEGAVPSRINKMSLSGNANGMTLNGLDETSRVDGSRAGGIRAYWKEEAGTATATKPKFRQIEMKLNKLMCLVYTTDEMLQDASVLQSVVEKGCREEIDFKITDAVINGDGAGRPLGIMNAGCLVSVDKTTSQTAATIDHTNIARMWSRMPAYNRKNAVWMINQDCEESLNLMGSDSGNINPVYMPPGGLKDSPYAGLATMYGRPVLVLEQCQTVGTPGDIILADLTQYMAIDKGSINQAVSMHVRFLYDEQVFKFTYRFDGQPALASAITPFKGSNTLSHFITVAVRA